MQTREEIQKADEAVSVETEAVQAAGTEIALKAVIDHVQAKAVIEAPVQAAAVTVETALLVREAVQAVKETAQEQETNIYFYM